ncbi:MAG: hypothetical protein D6713_07815 [Deltaproteobacteria bacterium]|nr:MAG: hypothetical protein D6713_07815 [Deltaproteobacteria bacterium]
MTTKLFSPTLLILSPEGNVRGMTGPPLKVSPGKEPLQGKPFTHFLSPEDMETWDRERERVISSAQEKTLTLRVITPEGPIPYLASLRAVEKEGEVVALVCALDSMKKESERQKEIITTLSSLEIGKEFVEKLLRAGKTSLTVRNMSFSFGRMFQGKRASAGLVRNGNLLYRELAEVESGRLYSLFLNVPVDEVLSIFGDDPKPLFTENLEEDPLYRRELREVVTCQNAVLIPLFSGEGELKGIVHVYDLPSPPSKELQRLAPLTAHLYSLILEHSDIEERLTEKKKDLQRITRGMADVYDILRPSTPENGDPSLYLNRKIEELERIITGLAHFMNNHLAAITGYCELLKVRYSDHSELVTRMDAILKVADRSSLMVKKLLSYGRKYAFTPTRVNVNEFLEEVIPKLKEQAGEKFTVKLEKGGVFSKTLLDTALVERGLTYLLENSVEACGDSGSIVISTSEKLLSPDDVKEKPGLKPGRYVIVKFSDDGPGFSPELKDDIFLPFFTTREERGAMGLGLSALYGIVKQHGGYIEAESIPGKGATFTLYFPVSPQ